MTSQCDTDANVSLSYCGVSRAAQLGRISTKHRAGEMEFPVLEEEGLSQCCCDLIFFFLVNSLGDYNRYVKCAIHLSPSATGDGEINVISSWTVGCLAYFSPYKWQGFLLFTFTFTLKKFLGENVAWLADGCMDFGKKRWCFAPIPVQRTWPVDEHTWTCIKRVWACSDRPSLM